MSIVLGECAIPVRVLATCDVTVRPLEYIFNQEPLCDCLSQPDLQLYGSGDVQDPSSKASIRLMSDYAEALRLNAQDHWFCSVSQLLYQHGLSRNDSQLKLDVAPRSLHI